VLSDWKANQADFKRRVNYADPQGGRTLKKSWNVTPDAMDKMLRWARGLVEDQKAGHYCSYGYVIYSPNVDNCGSFAIKCLAKAGIQITLPGVKSWIPFPSLIKDDVKTA
jgi:hypothetical protein